jgi:hypothetical protein
MKKLTKKQQRNQNEEAAKQAENLIVDGYKTSFIIEAVNKLGANRDFLHCIAPCIWEHHNSAITELAQQYK